MIDNLPPLDELRAAHNRLLIRYVRLLGSVSTVPLLYKNLPPRTTATNHELDPVVDETMRPRALGFIVRSLVHTHIRTKLDEIANAYRQLQHVINLETLEASEQAGRQRYGEFLQAGYQACVELRDSIGSWSARGALVAVSSPLVLAFAGLVGNSVFKTPSALTVALFALSLLYTLLYLGSWFRSSFLSKRDLFLAGNAESVYRVEDEVFRILRFGKRRELPLDLLAVELELVLVVVFLAGLASYELGRLPWFRAKSELWLDTGYVLIAVAATIGLGLGVLIHHVKGLLRRRDER